MTTYVLVPGACHGGWWFEPLADRLREHGHRAHALTLTGLDGTGIAGRVNLDTHIDDVTRFLTAEDLTDAVLVGHSYAGMVISGAADRLPGRIGSLVYLDAFVPQDGSSCWSLTTDEQREWYLGAGQDGLTVPPLPFFDPRATGHPLATLLQRIRLDSDLAHFRRTYVCAKIWEGVSPFAPAYERVRDDPQWTVHALESRHNVLRDAADEVLAILLAADREVAVP